MKGCDLFKITQLAQAKLQIIGFFVVVALVILPPVQTSYVIHIYISDMHLVLICALRVTFVYLCSHLTQTALLVKD